MNALPDQTILDALQTRARLAYPPLVAALRRALVEVDDGRIRCPDRSVVPLRDGTTMLSMPAVADDLAIHKLITVALHNAGRSLPVILGAMTVLDPATGQPLMILDGPTVTGCRTAALSMLAVDVLHPAPICTALLIGTGTQAQHHVDALVALFPHVALRVRATSAAAAEAFCRRNAGQPMRIAPESGGDDFEVVFSCTTSRTPVYRDAARADRLVVAVGSFHPDAAEIDAATVRGSTVYVDDRRGAEHEAGDLILAGVRWSDVSPLSDALTRGLPPAGTPLLFKSVGCAAWDLAAARVAVASGP